MRQKCAALYTPEGVHHMDSKDQYDDLIREHSLLTSYHAQNLQSAMKGLHSEVGKSSLSHRAP